MSSQITRLRPFVTRYGLGNCLLCKQSLRPGQSVVGLRVTGPTNTTAYAHANKSDCKSNA